MELQGSYTLNTPRAEVWEVLTDPDRVTPLLPSGEIVAESGERWRARLSVPTALGTSTFDFTFTLVEQRPQEHVRVTGHGYGHQNVIDLVADLTLSETESGTEVRWESEVHLGGVLASLGQRSLPYVVHRRIEETLRNVDEQYSGALA